MAKKKSIGLPSGPNEYLQNITQFISVDGYRNDSPDKTNPVNFIPSGSISMKDVDFPIMGTDNLGNSQMMLPENAYQFPGDMVMEIPQAQFGIKKKLNQFKTNLANNYRTGIGYNKFQRDVKGIDKFGDDPGGKGYLYAIKNAFTDIYNAGTNAGVVENDRRMINEDADSDRTDTTTLEQNAFRLYLQQEQNAANPNNKFNISDYRPSVGDTPEDVYYSIPPQQRKEVYGDNAFPESLSYNGSDFDWKELENKYSGQQEEDMVVGTYTKGIGRNDDGSIYLSAYDKWDLNPLSQMSNSNNPLAKFIGDNVGDLSMGLGKPFNIYDRVNYVPESPGSSRYVKQKKVPEKQLGGLVKLVKEGIKQAPKYMDDIFRSFKKFDSEIDWGAFNKSIPENKILMQEYNLIEETTKANKTWMKNADGSVFKGTPEQFVQMKSGNFQKAYPDGYQSVYRGVDNPGPDPLRSGTKNIHYVDKTDHRDNMTGLFSGDRLVGDYYGDNVHNLAMRNSPNSLSLEGLGFDWSNLGNIGVSKKMLKKNIDYLKKEIKEFPNDGSFSEVFNNNSASSKPARLKSFENFYNNYDEIVANPTYQKLVSDKETLIKSMHGKDFYSTDNLAQFLQREGLDNIQLNYIDDGLMGKTNINNQIPGNYYKNLQGNNGMFDLTNPDMYKQYGGASSIYKLATDDDYKWTDALYDNSQLPTISHALDILSIPGALVGEAGEYFGERGDGEFNFSDAMPGFKGDFSFKNMNDTEIKNLAGTLDKDGNPLVENAWGAFALNVLTDPSSYVGAGLLKAGVKKIATKTAPLIKKALTSSAKSTDDIIKATADDMVEVFTSDGSKKLMKKADAIRLNRIEDANVNNKTFTNYEDGNWFSDEIQPFYLNNAKNTLKGGILNPNDPKRVMSAYLDPEYAKFFDVSTQGTSAARNLSGGKGNLPIKGEYVLPPALVKSMREGTSGLGYNTMIGNSESIMKNLDAFYKKLGGGVYQEGGSWKDIDVDIEGVKKAIAQAESLSGKLMKNKESTASGLYGQRFSELDKYNLYDGTRDEFIADKDAQERIFNMRLNEGFVSKKGDTITTPLIKDAYDLTLEYKDQLGDDWDYSYEDIINLSNFIGRGGTRKYFGDVIRDGKKLEDVYPTLFGPNAKQSNKTPEEYLKISREFYKGGGEKTIEEMTPTERINQFKRTPEQEEFVYNNWTRADGTVEPKTLYEKAPTKLRIIEESVDKYLGKPAQTAFDLYPGGDSSDDAKRHAYASALTASKTSPLIANMLGFGHEFGAKNLGSEHLKDVGNNFIGSVIGGVPFVDDMQRKKMVEWLSDNGLLFKEGGSLPKAQFGNREAIQDGTQVTSPYALDESGYEKFIYDLENPIQNPLEFNPVDPYKFDNPLETAVDNTYVDSNKNNKVLNSAYLDFIQSENPELSQSEIEDYFNGISGSEFKEYIDPVLIADFIKKSNYFAEGWKDMGSASENEIMDLQGVLASKGYNLGKRGKDGIYGNMTYTAHRAMVDDNNLSPTSIGRYYKKYGKNNYEEVKDIQTKLIKEGYLSPTLINKKTSSIDGKFGDQTKNALDAFNTDNAEEDTQGLVFNNIPSRLEEERCAAGMCSILEQNNVLTEAIGVKYKDAWDLFESMTNADNSKSIYNIYDSKLFDNVNETTSVEKLKDITRKVKNNSQTKVSDYKVGDIVGIYWQGSSHHKETLNSKTFNTHSGFVSEIDENGTPIITHNVNGRVIQQPYNEISTAWIRRPNEDVEVRSQYEVNDDDIYNDNLAISNLEMKYDANLSEKRKEEVSNILKRATYNSVKIPEILNSSVDSDWLKAATFGITGVESGVGLNAPRTIEEARSANSGLQGLAYDYKGKTESGISLGIGKTKFASLDKFARQYFDITSPKDLADDNKAVDAVSYILTKNYELFKDYAKQYPQLGLTEIDIRNMSILAYNQGTNRLINTGRVDDERSSEEEIAALRELYEGSSSDVSSTKYRFIPGGDFLYDKALALGIEEPAEKYISKVNGYIEDVFPQTFALNNADPFEVTTLAKGGEYGVFKNFIDGYYDGGPREGYAKNLHDRLNRRHYNQAKAMGMSPANYIMTNVIGNS
tara:strand:+ start:3281 stop:9535 length:6255 start_codon:yes stop_codon:yes gene_type:complete